MPVTNDSDTSDGFCPSSRVPIVMLLLLFVFSFLIHIHPVKVVVRLEHISES